jgi:hypothetical protein
MDVMVHGMRVILLVPLLLLATYVDPKKVLETNLSHFGEDWSSLILWRWGFGTWAGSMHFAMCFRPHCETQVVVAHAPISFGHLSHVLHLHLTGIYEDIPSDWTKMN